MGDWKPRMHKAVRHLAEQLTGIRAGRLSVGFVETFRATSQGNSVAIGRMASVANRGDRIIVTPFDPADVPSIVKSLVEARLNAYALDPRTVCVGVPPPSGEQRAEIAKHVKRLGEAARISIRSIRQEARKEIAARGRGSERAVQEATDAAIAEVERLLAAKARELDA